MGKTTKNKKGVSKQVAENKIQTTELKSFNVRFKTIRSKNKAMKIIPHLPASFHRYGVDMYVLLEHDYNKIKHLEIELL